ncbi:hypothetical protein VHEMI04690 [[Torrubiella] hemipterigena]|uniref:Ecp2 effector protein domain-containing protein n=1 Tax=[Torrubiella] hemipterigena TaxID=1531966 RepID=A0A0A1TEK8_9HYPO|nr:hypothetical protein VHEMI04690 [[Torrubiella] hemipterigena]
MKFTTVFLTILATASAFVIPEGSRRDGIYLFSKDANGNDVMEFKPYAKADGITGVTPNVKRDDRIDVGCEGPALDRNDEHQAWLNARQWCTDGNSQGYGAIAMPSAGSALYYMCVFTSHAQTCNNNEIDLAGARLNNQCGLGGGYVFFHRWNKSIGRTVQGQRFCTNL